jgi:hypothetical protein
MQYGYNFAAVCEAAAKFRDPKTGAVYAHVLIDGVPTELDSEQWDDLFSILAGSDVTKIQDAIWTLNEYDPAYRLQALVKASGAATRSDSI